MSAIAIIPESEFEALKRDILLIKDTLLTNRPGSLYEDLITVEQLREKLGGVHDTTIWRHEKSGRLKPIKIGANKMYRLSEVISLGKK